MVDVEHDPYEGQTIFDQDKNKGGSEPERCENTNCNNPVQPSDLGLCMHCRAKEMGWSD